MVEYLEIVFCWRAARSFVGRLLEVLQSILFFRNLIGKPVHVQLRWNEHLDVSAEASGVKWVKHSELQGRKYEVYRLPVKMNPDIVSKYIGKKYDYFFYLRWWWKVSLVQIPIVLAVVSFFSWKIALGVLAGYLILWFPINELLKSLSKNTWACSEVLASICWDHDVDFGYSTRFSASSPVDEYEKVRFVRQFFPDGIELIKHGATV